MSKRSLLDRKLYVLTENEVATWSSVRRRMGRDDFGCLLCGKRFKGGDAIRFIYANFEDSPIKLGNFFVCSDCDDEDEVCLDKAAELVTTINPILADKLRHNDFAISAM